jgi:hypothetical protein
MAWQPPSPSIVWQAIDVYLKVAYEGAPPIRVVSRLNELRACGETGFYASRALERDPERPARLALRLGNRFYPHAKLVIESTPDGSGALFHAESHDQHCCPDLSSPDYPAFHRLMEQNQQVAQEVEKAWAKQGLPTFRQLLRQNIHQRIRAS